MRKNISVQKGERALFDEMRYFFWYGLLLPQHERGLELLKMEFRRFLHRDSLIQV